MNKNLNGSKNFSRRDFIRTCGIGAAAAATTTLLGGFVTKAIASPKFTAQLYNESGLHISSYLYSLDQNWLFGGRFNAEALQPNFNDKHFTKVSIPHCVSKLSWQNWDPSDWEDVWIYRRHFTMPESSKGLRVFLNFDGVMVGRTPVINGHNLPEYLGGYLPNSYEITNWIHDKENILAVKVDSRWSNVPPEGSPEGPKRIDYLEPGGIFRSVNIIAVPQTFISDVFAKPVKVLDSDRHIEVQCTIDAANVHPKPIQIQADLLDGDKVISSTKEEMKLEKIGETEAKLTISKLGNIKLWHVDTPNLYHVLVKLIIDDKLVHEYKVRIGLRDARFELEGFFLNGKRLQLFGLNRHELYPYVGYAMPERVMRHDAEILRREFNCNVVRCSHYPQNEAFFNACDEFGLMAWEEVPGWGYLGDETWKNLLIRDTREMVTRDRNHASIIIWGVRANETPNDPVLYRQTKEIAKKLDGSRPTSGSMTGGSMKTWKEDWHQDVLAYDDYHTNKPGMVELRKPAEGVPYMLAEAVGQYNYNDPKAGFSSYYRRSGDVEFQKRQAIYHAQAHNEAAKNPRFCGVIAWCGFEYGSLVNAYHSVKYPGVADVFRVPKLGASFYQSQISPKDRPVIIPDFYWDFGVKTPKGPGKNSVIFSNCERLELFTGGKAYKTLHPDSSYYSKLKYPPFFVDLDLDGENHPELRIDGYVDNKLVLTKLFSSDPALDKFYVKADDKELTGDGSDATRIEFKVTDKYGEPRLHGGGKVSFEIKGPGEIVGDNPFNLEESGGVAAVWIKTKPDSSGVITVEATHIALGSKSVTIMVIHEEQVERI